MLGGLGVCGRRLCCNSFLGEFIPVSIKMAKEQVLSLNPTKISGTCGRLMCCLKYEQDTYEALGAGMPNNGSLVKMPDGTGTVVNTATLKRTVLVRFDNDPVMRECLLSDLAVLRKASRRDDDQDSSRCV